LLADGSGTPASFRGQLPACGTGVDSTPAAVIADAPAPEVVVHSAVVHVPEVPPFESIHVAVVIKVVVVPVAAVVAVTRVAESVVNASIETD
jgi:hypothetical protein